MTLLTHPFKVVLQKVVLRNFPKIRGKHFCRILCFNKALGLIFFVKFAKFFETAFFLQSNCERIPEPLLCWNKTLVAKLLEITCNPGRNILELFSILVQVWFASSETKLDIQHNKLGKRVAKRVSGWLKTWS